jgi:hypothetical protein
VLGHAVAVGGGEEGGVGGRWVGLLVYKRQRNKEEEERKECNVKKKRKNKVKTSPAEFASGEGKQDV